LKTRESEFQQKIDLPLVWHNPDEAKLCKIYVRRDFDFRVREQWEEAFVWLGRYLQLFTDVFGPAVKAL